MKRLSLLALGVVLLLGGCADKQKKSIAKVVQEWQNKEIAFPADLVFTKYGRDTVKYEIPLSSHKILMYVDSIGCTSCKLHLHLWKEFMAEVDSLTHGAVPFIFVFHPKDLQELSYLLKRDGIDVPVCMDLEDKLNAKNRFPSHPDFQTFLLDGENKVVLLGNPVHNLRVKEMYLSEISANKHQPSTTQSSRNTQIEADRVEFDLGTFSKGDSKTVTVSVKNRGSLPFVIFETRASCGCTRVDYEKRPILPDSTAAISITYHADDKGHFNKTVFVYGNIEASPLVIRLKGNIE